MSTVLEKTKICTECSVPLIVGENWSESQVRKKTSLCNPCNNARVKESNKLKGRTCVRLFGPADGMEPHQKAWRALPLEVKRAELERQRIIESDTSGYTPAQRKAWNAKRRTIGGKRVYVSGDIITFPKKELPPASPTVAHRTVKVTSRNDAKFKRAVILRDNGKCIITGTEINDYRLHYMTTAGQHSSKTMVHVAHIVPHAKCAEGQHNDPNNGILLRADMHGMFDNAMFTIGSGGQVLPSRLIPAEWFPPYITMDEITLEMSAYFAEHREWCFRHWNRWAF